ncbi:MAG: putative cytochrome hydroxylase [Ilumatobacteraceae bacterium]|nr:putative cytochrome hydroxylase [Ilumatobacteraceae bacterium]
MPANSYHRQRGIADGPPSGCPVDHRWSALDPDYLDDPYPIARTFGDQCPIMFSQQMGYVVVSRMEDIVAVFTDPDTYASENVQDPVFPLSDQAAAVLATPDFDPVAVMSNRPEPDHGRIRVFTRDGFSNRRLKALEPYIERRSHELIDRMLADRLRTGPAPVEFVRAFAFPLPGETVFRLIGFPEADDEMLKGWCVDRKAFQWGRPTPDQQRDIAEHMVSYWRYCREFTAERATNPADDLASELLAAHHEHPDQLSYIEVESIIYGLSFAGHEAVTSLIGNALLCLLPRRQQWDELCRDPHLITTAVEEVLRFESSQVSWRRITTRDTQLAGVHLPQGTQLLLNFAAANRQPDLFDRPDEFDIHRANAARHISFGKGIHYCLGANLAKVELRIVLQALSQRIPSLRLTPDQQIRRFPNITFRGPEQLLVEWDTARETS